eukprot:TRINITY_DN4653_c0_g1_i1.p1 TRINITY_DN4653_c0_g1~~TRINITY_DN4653_c0_g1_i1.p1  ORF type:complete len:711 (-),score=122.70 TRINITY_DN4653_c0_g1_i1:103-2235(-)
MSDIELNDNMHTSSSSSSEDFTDSDPDISAHATGAVVHAAADDTAQEAPATGEQPESPRWKNTVPITITFKHLAYRVDGRSAKQKLLDFCRPSHDKWLLKDLHGSVPSGQLTCIMGPSGAGKTTLLNLLTGKVTGGKVKGDVLINGRPRKKLGGGWKRLYAYVTQDDVLSANLSPKEELWFSAKLRMSIGRKELNEKVAALIKELGLSKCAKQRIGNVERRGISGGQRKRTAIGVELVTEPSVLFLDEPTSGLDYSTSYTLIETLSSLAKGGRTIVSTIHQPSTDIFLMFDKLILMSEGHIIYQGPTKEVVPYFANLGCPCPQYTNPAEHIMNLAKLDSYISSNEEGIARVTQLVSAYRSMNYLRRLKFKEEPILLEAAKPDEDEQPDEEEGTEDVAEKDDNSGAEELADSPYTDKKLKPAKRPWFPLRMGLLIYRTLVARIREPMTTYIHVVQTIFLSLMVGILFLRIGDDYDQDSITDRKGVLFFIITNECVDTLMTTIMLFEAEHLIYIKEHSASVYGTLLYFLAKNAAEFPFLVIFPTLFSCICYWMVGLQAEAENFFIFVAALCLITLVAAALSIAIRSAVDSMDTAMAILPAAFIPFTIFSGYLISEDSIPVWIRWVRFFSFFKYGFNILAINEFDGLTFTCSDADKRADGTCVFSHGDDVLRDLNLDKDENSLWASFLFLLMQLMFWTVLGYLFMRFNMGRKK